MSRQRARCCDQLRYLSRGGGAGHLSTCSSRPRDLGSFEAFIKCLQRSSSPQPRRTDLIGRHSQEGIATNGRNSSHQRMGLGCTTFATQPPCITTLHSRHTFVSCVASFALSFPTKPSVASDIIAKFDYSSMKLPLPMFTFTGCVDRTCATRPPSKQKLFGVERGEM